MSASTAVKSALPLGYRHIDTAERYGNETEVGEGLQQGLRASGLRREDVFVTTKVYHDKLAAADFERSFDESLGKLRLPWVDLLLIHWPNPNVPLAETLGSSARPGATAARGMSAWRISPPRCSRRRPSSRASRW